MTSVDASENVLLWRVYDFSRNAQVLNWKVNVARKPKTIIFPQITSIKNSPSEILRKQSTICDCGMVLFEAFENYGFIFWKRLETIRRCVNPVEVCYIHTHTASAIAFNFESVFGGNLFFRVSNTGLACTIGSHSKNDVRFWARRTFVTAIGSSVNSVWNTTERSTSRMTNLFAGSCSMCTRTMGCHIFYQITSNKLSTQLWKYFVATIRDM